MDIYVNYKQNKLTFLTLLREKLVTLGIEYEGWSPKQVTFLASWKLSESWINSENQCLLEQNMKSSTLIWKHIQIIYSEIYVNFNFIENYLTNWLN